MLLAAGRVAAFPVAIEACVTAGSCLSAGPVGGYSLNGQLVPAHRLFEFDGANVSEKRLMEYRLGSGVRIEPAVEDPVTGQTVIQHTAITGTLWLKVDVSYDLANPLHATTRYLGQASQGVVRSGWGDYGLPPADGLGLQITTAGLFAGFGEAFAACVGDPLEGTPASFPPFTPASETNPSLFDSNGNGPVVCVADGCFYRRVPQSGRIAIYPVRQCRCSGVQ